MLKRHIVWSFGVVLGLIVLSATFFYWGSQRWEGTYVLGDIYTVGTQRMEIRDPHGKTMFVEFTPDTRVWRGHRQVSIADLVPGVRIMVLGPMRSGERIAGDTIRIMTPAKREEPVSP